MRKLVYIIILCTATLYSCEDESNDPIVVSTNGGTETPDEEEENGEEDGNTLNCDFTEIESDFVSCISPTSVDNLEVVTWNIEHFPNRGATTLAAVESIIYNTNADVVALQEIESINEMNAIADNLPDWEAAIVDISGSLNMGFLYNTCQITSYTAPVAVGVIEPRPAVMTKINHVNGLEVTILTIHLKCCGGSSSINRRATASENLKSYIEINLPNANVIVLGDYNDDIDLNQSTPFANFINDVDNYRFADTDIAAGSVSNYSYPDWPSHIDHILVTNELFDNLQSTETIKLEGCVSGYISNVSDHRPVMTTFKPD